MPFNLAAPGECSNVLFTRLRLPPPAGAKRLKNNTFSTKVTVPRLLARVCAITQLFDQASVVSP